MNTLVTVMISVWTLLSKQVTLGSKHSTKNCALIILIRFFYHHKKASDVLANTVLLSNVLNEEAYVVPIFTLKCALIQVSNGYTRQILCLESFVQYKYLFYTFVVDQENLGALVHPKC